MRSRCSYRVPAPLAAGLDVGVTEDGFDRDHHHYHHN
jgi:hypothetical protein